MNGLYGHGFYGNGTATATALRPRIWNDFQHSVSVAVKSLPLQKHARRQGGTGVPAPPLLRLVPPQMKILQMGQKNTGGASAVTIRAGRASKMVGGEILPPLCMLKMP